jgi:hypothetical protein
VQSFLHETNQLRKQFCAISSTRKDAKVTSGDGVYFLLAPKVPFCLPRSCAHIRKSNHTRQKHTFPPTQIPKIFHSRKKGRDVFFSNFPEDVRFAGFCASLRRILLLLYWVEQSDGTKPFFCLLEIFKFAPSYCANHASIEKAIFMAMMQPYLSVSWGHFHPELFQTDIDKKRLFFDLQKVSMITDTSATPHSWGSMG